MAEDNNENMQKSCVAGLKLGEYVPELAEWCGKQGEKLKNYISQLASNVNSPVVRTSATFYTLQLKDRVEIELMKADNPFLGDALAIKDLVSLQIIPEEFRCEGHLSFTQATSYIKKVKSCEGCPLYK